MKPDLDEDPAFQELKQKWVEALKKAVERDKAPAGPVEIPIHVTCRIYCSQGCVMGIHCPHLGHLERALEFIDRTPWDQLMEIADRPARI